MFVFTWLVSLAMATDLFVANYGGQVVHLRVIENEGNYSLDELESTTDCGANPGWLEIDKSKNILLCMNEAYVGSSIMYYD